MKNRWAVKAVFLLAISFVFSLAMADTLIEQPVSSSNPYAYATQDFETASNAFDCFWADDFVVPSDTSWFIQTIKVWGACWNNGTTLLNAISLNCYVFADASGLPDGIPAGYGGNGIWSESWAPNDSNVTIFSDGSGTNCCFEVDVNNPPLLAEGTYWLACYPQMDFATGGQWGFHVSDTTNAAIAKWVNPGNGFGLGATNWTSITSISVWGLSQKDIAFGLYGQSSPPAVDAINPASGTNDGTVSVTITGNYFIDGNTEVKLSGPAKADIAGENVVVVNEQTLNCDFNLEGAEVGLYDVVVTTPLGDGALEDGFEVTTPSDDDTDDDTSDDDTDDDSGGDDDDGGGCGC